MKVAVACATTSQLISCPLHVIVAQMAPQSYEKTTWMLRNTYFGVILALQWFWLALLLWCGAVLTASPAGAAAEPWAGADGGLARAKL